MPRLLGSHHTTLQAPTEEALDRALSRWRTRFESELGDYQNAPEGRLHTHRDCCGTHSYRVLPSWLPAPVPPAHQLFFRFVAQKIHTDERWMAHLCAELLEKDPEPLPPTENRGPPPACPGGDDGAACEASETHLLPR